MKSIDEILETLDQFLSEGEIKQAEELLLRAFEEAVRKDEPVVVIPVVNELIGFYRDTGRYQESLAYCRQIIPYLESHGLEGTIHYATTCLNIANACRAAGEWEAAQGFFDKVEELYRRLLPAGDSLYASYYNNLSLLYQERKCFEKASQVLRLALDIIEPYRDRIKIATTCSNLAASLLQLNKIEEAEEYISRSLNIYREEGENDFHYGAALAVMGELMFRKKQYAEAREYYKKALSEQEKYVGKTDFYYRISDCLKEVERVCKEFPVEQMLEEFFEEYGKPLLEEKFSDYLDKIAVGMAGEGSECLGFSDELSQDHDFGPGFCLWVTRDTYQQIGKELEEEYAGLPLTYRGITRHNMETADHRTGVCIIEDFYKRLIGLEGAPESIREWMELDETSLRTATSGKILLDPEGIFSGIRECLLAYYPEEVWRARIAQKAALMSQYGQYNYGRMMLRKDYVSAQQCRSRFLETAMEMLYLLNRTYAPYYKWLYRGLKELDCYGIRELVYQVTMTPLVNGKDNEALMEEICVRILNRLDAMGLVQKNGDTYLEHYAKEIVNPGIHKEESVEKKADIILQEELVKELVELEWQCFDQVDNEGGRADCQDDRNTFFLMRCSQYLTWTEEMLKSYIWDFRHAIEKGWNPVTEKYGRMMESTAPERFKEIEPSLPVLPPEKKAIIEEIVKIQVRWMEEFASLYPKMAGNSRSIHTKEDSPYNTSFETYLRGELGTYSDTTLDLYGRFIVSYLQKGKNLTEEIMKNTAIAYGYETLEAAEQAL
ncbi:MAG: DUF4125 family protein [Lachnospiraceae bacterium]